MAGSVIQRKGTTITDAGVIVHDDASMPWEAADELAGHRVDRRRTYSIIDGELCDLASWTEACTGCTEVPEMTMGPDRGCGCHECGYTGHRRNSYFVPYQAPQQRAA